ncbi:MAG: Dyp-type peroxidase [Thermoleophilaceae bacterium]|nr:Dyp-type peroxidase [Thermoleophilaceae bacterium]
MNPARPLQLENIQGALLRGYRLPLATYLFLTVKAPASARLWLGEMAEEVLTAAPWEAKPDWALNLYVTYAGLGVLGVPESALATFPGDFRAGMAARADLLGDTGASAPERWEEGIGGPDVHLMVMLSGADRRLTDERRRWLRDSLERAGGLGVLSEQRGGALPGNREHFGYADGFSQPPVEGFEDDRPRPGGGAPQKQGGWRPIRAGEFVLGYPDEEGVSPPEPAPPVLGRDGSYLVFRKLAQDVVGFRAMLDRAMDVYPFSEELLAAKLVGRFRDGTPLDRLPDGPDPSLVADPDRNNDFRYADDPEGLRCPVGAHVRRANPRESMPFQGKLVNRHRILRRGITYGPPLPEGSPEDGQDRGVLFMCFQASIKRQFEFVQAQWFNDGNAFRLGDDKDVLLGDHDGTAKTLIPGRPPTLISPLSRLVSTRGGEYFFCPSIAALRHLSAVGA